MKKETAIVITVMGLMLLLMFMTSCATRSVCTGVSAKPSKSHAVTFNSKDFSKRHYR